MSAFFVGFPHINAMITMGMDMKRSFSHPLTGNMVSLDRNSAQAFGAALVAANVASLAARYPGSYADLLGDDNPDAYRFEADHNFTVRPDAMIALVKLCDCFDYQACEVENYESSGVARFVNELARGAVARMRGYDAAPWGYEGPPAGAPKVISLADMAHNFATAKRAVS